MRETQPDGVPGAATYQRIRAVCPSLGARVRAATRLLPHRDDPFPGGARFRQLTGPDGACRTTRTRLACCLSYMLGPGETCLTCPRTPDVERIRRLAQP